MGFFGSRPQGGAGSDKQVVFNDAGRFAGASGFTFDKVGRILSVENCEVLGLLAARGGLKMSTTPPPVDSPVVPGEMAFWFDPPSGLLNVLAIDPSGTATLFQLVRADDARMTDARTPVAHKHAGSDVTSPVSDAQNASAVPWAGVTGKPANFPPTGHQHAGGDITSPVANANAAATVPWTGVTGVPAQFPPAGHTHSGADIQPSTLAGDRLVDGTVTASKLAGQSVDFSKVRVDGDAIPNSASQWQALNGGIGFQPGCYLFRLNSATGQVATFVATIGLSNGSFTWANGLNSNCALNVMMGTDSLVVQITQLGDGREYGLYFDLGTGAASFRTVSGNTNGSTTVSYRRII